jgi:DAK2 domain fusion protein YloV
VEARESEAARAAASAAAGGSLAVVLDEARRQGADALARTPEMLPVLKQAGVVDAGGCGFLLLLDVLLHVVEGRAVPEPDVTAEGPVLEAHGAIDAEHAALADLRYEVMYLLEADDAAIPAFKDVWAGIGDSIVVVGGDGLWNCHVHTNDIGAAIEVALDLGGRPKQIRITDLFEEVADEQAHRQAGMHAVPVLPGAGLPPVTCAVVAVCSGEGLVELFWNLGVQGIVTGGQTMNPSTAELLDTVEHVNADQVVILPNNKNIVPVAEQVDALTSKSVVVVPSRTMPEALAALIVYDPEASVEENAAEMCEAIESIATGEVTQAVRDSNSDAGPIAAGDWMGLVRGDGIVAVGTSAVEVSTRLLDRLIDPDRELLTIITGAEADPADLAAIEGWVADQRADVQVEVHRGGQPLYPFLFGVE